MAEDGEIIIRADQRAESRKKSGADGVEIAGHELRRITVGKGGVRHR